MSHQPFENWLLSGETLPPENTRALQEHVRNCEACQKLEAGWAGVRHVILAAPPVAPLAGFSARWQMRLAEEQLQRQRKQSWKMLGLTAGAAALILVLLALQAAVVLRNPSDLLLSAFTRLTALLLFAQASRDVLLSIWRSLLTLVPLPLWVFVPGLISFVLVLWLVTYQQLTSARRIRL